jgi:hypothetical protein
MSAWRWHLPAAVSEEGPWHPCRSTQRGPLVHAHRAVSPPTAVSPPLLHSCMATWPTTCLTTWPTWPTTPPCTPSHPCRRGGAGQAPAPHAEGAAPHPGRGPGRAAGGGCHCPCSNGRRTCCAACSGCCQRGRSCAGPSRPGSGGAVACAVLQTCPAVDLCPGVHMPSGRDPLCPSSIDPPCLPAAHLQASSVACMHAPHPPLPLRSATWLHFTCGIDTPPLFFPLLYTSSS